LTSGLLDTSVFIARESHRKIEVDLLPDLSAVSAVTIGELRWGVLMAPDDRARSVRLDTLGFARDLEPLDVDEAVAGSWALLRQQLKATGRRMEVNDSWIAATAIAHDLPLMTQDRGFRDIPGLTVIEV